MMISQALGVAHATAHASPPAGLLLAGLSSTSESSAKPLIVPRARGPGSSRARALLAGRAASPRAA